MARYIQYTFVHTTSLLGPIVILLLVMSSCMTWDTYPTKATLIDQVLHIKYEPCEGSAKAVFIVRRKDLPRGFYPGYDESNYGSVSVSADSINLKGNNMNIIAAVYNPSLISKLNNQHSLTWNMNSNKKLLKINSFKEDVLDKMLNDETCIISIAGGFTNDFHNSDRITILNIEVRK